MSSQSQSSVDIYNRTTTLGGVMSADATRLTFSGDPTVEDLNGVSGTKPGLILQEVGVNYSQQITRLYALESGNLYFVAGRTEGGITVKHVVGPSGMATAFYKQYGDVCQAAKNAFNLEAAVGCTGNAESTGAASIKLKNPVISKIGLSVSAQDFIIFSDFEGTFATLTLG